MNRKTPAQRLWALILLAALPILSGAIPILDLMVGDGKPAVETHHIPGTHGFPHNHLLCIQHQASQWGPEPDARPGLGQATVDLPEPSGRRPLLSPGCSLLPKARAPPPV